MFKCAQCGRQQGLHVRPNMVVLETELVNYPFRKAANRPFRTYSGQTVIPDDKGGSGWQIVHEGRLCERCAVLHTANTESDYDDVRS